MGLKFGYLGRKEYRGFSGKKTVAWIHEICGQFYPIVQTSKKLHKGRVMPTLRAAIFFCNKLFKNDEQRLKEARS